MKEFFLDLLQELDKLTGIKQWDRISHSKDETNELLDILTRTCQMFPLIPVDAQKSILRHAVISDGDFIGLNAKWVYKSLNAQRDRFFKEAAHIPSEVDPNWKPVEGEARNEWLKKWQESLGSFGTSPTKSHVQELVERLPPKEKGHSYPSTSAEKVLAAMLHNDYIRANYNPDGSKKEGWKEENEWLTVTAKSRRK
jgi:hypothetical protein